MDWAVYLEHVQSILKEFNPSTMPNKGTLIKYFCNGLRSSIRAQLDKYGRYSDNLEEAVGKTVDAKVKVARQPNSIIKEINGQGTQDYWPM